MAIGTTLSYLSNTQLVYLINAQTLTECDGILLTVGSPRTQELLTRLASLPCHMQSSTAGRGSRSDYDHGWEFAQRPSAPHNRL